MLIFSQHDSADDVDAESDGADDHGFAIVDRDWRVETHHGVTGNRQRDNPEHECAGETGKIAEFARAERKLPVMGMAPGHPIGPGCEAKRANMGGHMDAVGQQRHRPENQAGRDFHDHEGGGQIDDQTRTGFGPL